MMQLHLRLVILVRPQLQRFANMCRKYLSLMFLEDCEIVFWSKADRVDASPRCWTENQTRAGYRLERIAARRNVVFAPSGLAFFDFPAFAGFDQFFEAVVGLHWRAPNKLVAWFFFSKSFETMTFANSLAYC